MRVMKSGSLNMENGPNGHVNTKDVEKAKEGRRQAR